MILPLRKTDPRAEHRLRESQRVTDSVRLAEKFPKLKSLTLDLSYYDPEGMSRAGEVKYKVNVEHAKSVFSFACQSSECVAGSFDLSDVVTEAITQRRKSAQGEIRCPGTRERPRVGHRPCLNLLRYKLTLAYV